MADGILQLLEYYECVPQIFAVCCDTTFSNTGHLVGAIKMLTEAIYLPLLHVQAGHVRNSYNTLYGSSYT